MKIGVSSQNFRTITGHAGKARRFFVFKQQGDEIIELDRIDLPKEMSMHEYHGNNHPVYKLDILITAGCGRGFVNRMASHDVQVIATADTDPKVAVENLLAGKSLTPPAPHEH